jgi:hypothetical protein
LAGGLAGGLFANNQTFSAKPGMMPKVIWNPAQNLSDKRIGIVANGKDQNSLLHGLIVAAAEIEASESKTRRGNGGAVLNDRTRNRSAAPARALANDKSASSPVIDTISVALSTGTLPAWNAVRSVAGW